MATSQTNPPNRPTREQHFKIGKRKRSRSDLAHDSNAKTTKGNPARQHAAEQSRDGNPSNPGISQQQLAQRLGILPSRVVAFVDDLERLRLVERVPTRRTGAETHCS